MTFSDCKLWGFPYKIKTLYTRFKRIVRHIFLSAVYEIRFSNLKLPKVFGMHDLFS